MKSVLGTHEILGTVSLPEGPFEVCVSAEAFYDEVQSQVTVQLNSFLRTTDLRAREQHRTVPWLPEPETVRETVDREEAAALARDVFHSWVHKVRESVPAWKTTC